MQPETASLVLDLIALVAGLVWLAGAIFVRRTRALCSEPHAEEVPLGRDPEAALATLARALGEARRGSPFLSATLDHVAARELRWHATGPVRHTGAVVLTGRGSTSHAQVTVLTGRGLMVVANWLVVLAAIVTTGLYVLLSTYVLPGDEVLRVQVVQMAQAVHLLWPPFLMAGVTRRFRSLLVDEVRRVLTNATRLAAVQGS